MPKKKKPVQPVSHVPDYEWALDAMLETLKLFNSQDPIAAETHVRTTLWDRAGMMLSPE